MQRPERREKQGSISKALLFYNPTAGSGIFRKKLDHIIEQFENRGIILVPIRSMSGLEAEEVLRSIRPEEYTRIIAAGGDGTLNVVLNAMMRCGCKLPLAVFPAGTANDYAYCLGIPKNLDKMIEIAINGACMTVDVGKCGERYFENSFSIGSVIDAAHKTGAAMKNSMGMLAYYLEALHELPSLAPVEISMEAVCENGEIRRLDEAILFLIVINGTSVGGFRKIGACTSINDCFFDVIMIKKAGFAELSAAAGKLLRGNTEDDQIIHFRASRMHISSKSRVATDVDGELGEQLPADIEVIPNAVKVLVPFDACMDQN